MIITMNETFIENQHIFVASRKDLGVGGVSKSLRCKDFKPVGNYWTIPYTMNEPMNRHNHGKNFSGK